MPAHGHGLPTKPVVRDGARPGTYIVEGMKFTMPGHWVVEFNIRSGPMRDTVKFNLELK